jgi:hypothetical protein
MRPVMLLALSLVAAACSSDEDGTRCGSGTVEVDGRCEAEDQEPTGPVCGDGTHEKDGMCVADVQAWYALRAASAEISADGISKIPILAIGRGDDGATAGEVILTLDREDRGQLLATTATLGELGAAVDFRPCNALTEAGCAGPVELRMALAEDPDAPVATLALELVEPAPVKTAEPCLGGGSALFIEGEGWVYTGTLTVTEGEWSIFQATDDLVQIELQTTEENGLFWFISFSSQRLSLPLVPGVYEQAEGQPFETYDRPGLSISGNGSGCNTISGRFQVHEYVRDETGVQSATVSFEQYCEPYDATPQGYLNGCVHFEAAIP